MPVVPKPPTPTPDEMAFQRHLKELGLKTTEDYLNWCTENGFSRSIRNKGAVEYRHELRAFKSARAEALLKTSKLRSLSPRLIQEICQDPESFLPAGPVANEALRKLAEFAKTATDSGLSKEYESYLQDLFRKNKDLLGLNYIVPPDGYQHFYNVRYLELVLEVFNHRDKWLNSTSDWKPKSHNGNKQVCSLLAHVFAKYPVPTFLYNTWLTTDSMEKMYREWFWLIGKGTSYKNLPNIPSLFSLTSDHGFTKRQAHMVLKAPANYKVGEAFFYGQIMGMKDGDQRLVDAILRSDTSHLRMHNFFWQGLFHIFIQNPMLDRNQFGPIFDYVLNQKFRGNPPPQPTFSWPGRTAESLLGQTEDWHAELARDRRARGARKSDYVWKPSGIKEMVREEGDRNKRTWKFRELLCSNELRDEGRAMKHCVASYDHSCKDGRIAIWSLTCSDPGDIERRHLTIEVNLSSKSIVQARQVANRVPDEKQRRILREWASKNNLNMSIP